ncbi:glycosyltransferase family 92 protein RCOM_0530710 [Trifolium pratense]|uniref:glycosyltransferase family 92 protein RCOM_0530710 n=1 Tax=Trifolium pratense TaxID=57577 RepID=UPI001E694E4D|nr:glycosyltransferase family 92 protein RCOM_0530710 [Trifolium pratense]
MIPIKKPSSPSHNNNNNNNPNPPLLPLITHPSSITTNIIVINNSTTLINSHWETMRRKPGTTLLISLLSILLFSLFTLHLSRNAVSTFQHLHQHHTNLNIRENHVLVVLHNNTKNNNNNNIVNEFSHQSRHVSSINYKHIFSTVSVLLPDWEILVIVNPNTVLSEYDDFNCLFRTDEMTPARFSGVLPYTNRTTFKCYLPHKVRRKRIFTQPMLVTGTSEEDETQNQSPAPELIRWNFMVYESFSTENDVVLFAKGVNHRQGYDRPPTELNCVFQIGDGIRTAVTSSVQEVFRCPHPDPFDLDSNSRIGVSLEIIAENIVVPSVAYYTPRPNFKPKPNYVAVHEFGPEVHLLAQPKYFLCACTMVYNVAKFLREWVLYHSKVGVENFILYDNGSNDDLEGIIKELNEEGYNITTLFWIWPKTQEAGFSHSILYSKSMNLCTWTMYVDVDEFMYSPSWGNIGNENFHSKNDLPSLKSMLPREHGKNEHGIKGKIGQVSMRCLEFGPSGQRQHPIEGVTQGYTCRRKFEQRHKSIVLIEAVDRSLWNVIHHFMVNEKDGFRAMQLSPEEGLVNHYKYQAWDEFKGKFRRRVSAYVVDWRQNENPHSKDRTPGLGFEAVEPNDWTQRFCEVRDQRLKLLTRKWFGSFTQNGFSMAWQTS